MAFVLSKSATYTWPVNIETATDGGKQRRESFTAEFRRLDQSRIDEINIIAARRQRQLEGKEPINPADDISDLEIANEILAGWSDIFDADGEQVPFTESAKKELIEIPTVAHSLCKAFVESMSGGAKRKNS